MKKDHPILGYVQWPQDCCILGHTHSVDPSKTTFLRGFFDQLTVTNRIKALKYLVLKGFIEYFPFVGNIFHPALENLLFINVLMHHKKKYSFLHSCEPSVPIVPVNINLPKTCTKKWCIQCLLMSGFIYHMFYTHVWTPPKSLKKFVSLLLYLQFMHSVNMWSDGSKKRQAIADWCERLGVHSYGGRVRKGVRNLSNFTEWGRGCFCVYVWKYWKMCAGFCLFQLSPFFLNFMNMHRLIKFKKIHFLICV